MLKSVAIIGAGMAGLTIPIVLFVVFWVIAIILWLTTGRIFYLFNFGYIGTALAAGLGVYASLPARKKPLGRRLAQFLVGAALRSLRPQPGGGGRVVVGIGLPSGGPKPG